MNKVTWTNKITIINKERLMWVTTILKFWIYYFLTLSVTLISQNIELWTSLANNISDPVLKCIVKYRIHPSKLAIGKVGDKHVRLPFSISKTNKEEILREILKLETSGMPRYWYSDKNYQRECGCICWRPSCKF